MKVDLTKEQYECLIKAVEAGNSVYGILGDNVSDEYKKQSVQIEMLQKYLLGHASDFGMEHMVDTYMGELILSDGFSKELGEAMDDYDDETFWNELEALLGQRDFDRTTTAKEQEEIKKNGGWYPDRIHKLYEKWNKEFEKNGIERLEIVE